MAKFINDLITSFQSRFFVILFGLLKTIIVARMLGPELNGFITSIYIYPFLFMQFGSLGLRKSSAYFIGKGITSEVKIKQSILHIWALMSLISLVICFLLIRYFSSSGDKIDYVLIAILPVPFSLLVNYISGLYLGKSEIREFNRINWLPVFFTFLFTVALVWYFELGILGVLISEAIGPIVMCLILLNKQNIFKYFSWKVDTEISKGLLSLGVVYALSLVLSNLNVRIDNIILDQMSTPYELGIYSKGVVIIQNLWQIPMLVATIVFSRSVATKNSNRFSLQVCKLLRVTLIINSIGALILVALSEYIIITLFGIEFKDSIPVSMYVSPGIVLFTVFKVLMMDISGRGKPWLTIYVLLPSLVLNVVLNIIFIPDYGAPAAAINSTISYGVATFTLIILYSRLTQIPLRQIFAFSKGDFDFVFQIMRKVGLLK